jgi:hypothetical protein
MRSKATPAAKSTMLERRNCSIMVVSLFDKTSDRLVPARLAVTAAAHRRSNALASPRAGREVIRAPVWRDAHDDGM